MVMCLHIGAGNPAPHASDETPIEAWIATMPMSSAIGASDWLNLEALHRFPLKVCLSECGIGWVPYFTERADFSHSRHKYWTHSAEQFRGKKPSDVFKEHFMICFIDDAYGLDNLKYMNENHVAYECDYPHSDTLWPEVPEYLWKTAQALTDEQIDKITHRNVMNFYNFDLFKNVKREDITVGALRAQAAAKGVDTTPKSYGGDAKPLADGETRRVVTSGDLFKMFAHHAEVREEKEAS